MPAFGLINSNSAKSCKEIKEKAGGIVTNKIYRVQRVEVCKYTMVNISSFSRPLVPRQL